MLVASLTIIVLLGCAKKSIIADEAIIRYQKVNIPGYVKSDYEHQIDSSNDEVKYNAICNLIPYAPKYAKILSKDSSEVKLLEKSSENIDKFKNAKSVFDAIVDELNSHNESIKAASLIFITEFSSEYTDKDELLELVLNVKTKALRTQYEQLQALIKLADPKKSIDPDLIKSFQKSRSWLIKSMTFLLLGEIASDNFHKNLITEYRNTNNEFDKLLIIHAFSKGFDTEVFNLLEGELVANQNPRIRNHCASILKMNKDDTAVIKWLVSNHLTIDDETLKAILVSYYSELARSKGKIFFEYLLRSNQERLIGLIDKEIFFEKLYDSLKNHETPGDLTELEIAVSDVDSLGKSWVEYQDKRNKEDRKRKEKSKREEEFNKNILPKYNVMLEKFLEESKKLFTDGGMDHDEVEESTKAMRELLQYLRNESK